MKTVFDNRMVAHVWAQGKQDKGRSHNGNFWFEGDTIWSYRTPIARMYESRIEGERIALITPRSFSMTTNGKHKPAIYRAAKTVRVPYFQDAEVLHSRNILYLIKCYNEMKESLKRKSSLYDGQACAWLEIPYGNIAKYCEAFGIETPSLNLEVDIAEVEEVHREKEEKRNTPEYIAKQAKKREAKERKKDEEEKRFYIRDTEVRNKWLNGDNVYWSGYDEMGGALLRVKGDVLETSQGAKVPLDHAIKAFRFIVKVREMGKVWETNGEQVKVGYFQVDSIDDQGNIKAGCHRINWSEINRVATQLGI